ncbi:transposase [Nocardia sp. CA-145437]|uniref:transposase n=1 Tax=Nocardia sp. CA-145437 TaxID=3239980 RepID=UPI003D993792
MGYEPADHAIGRSRGGLTTKIHLATDGAGRGLAVLLTPGQTNDSPLLPQLLDAVVVPRLEGGPPRRNPQVVIAGRAYLQAAQRHRTSLQQGHALASGRDSIRQARDHLPCRIRPGHRRRMAQIIGRQDLGVERGRAWLGCGSSARPDYGDPGVPTFTRQSSGEACRHQQTCDPLLPIESARVRCWREAEFRDSGEVVENRHRLTFCCDTAMPQPRLPTPRRKWRRDRPRAAAHTGRPHSANLQSSSHPCRAPSRQRLS